MILEEVGTYLEAHGVGIIAQTLFLGSMPQDEPGTGGQDAIMALIEIPGMSSSRTHDLAHYEQPVLQIATRGLPYGYPAARQKAQDAWALLDGLANTTLSGVFYLWALTMHSPFWLRTDELHRPYILFSVRFAKAVS